MMTAHAVQVAYAVPAESAPPYQGPPVAGHLFPPPPKETYQAFSAPDCNGTGPAPKHMVEKYSSQPGSLDQALLNMQDKLDLPQEIVEDLCKLVRAICEFLCSAST